MSSGRSGNRHMMETSKRSKERKKWQDKARTSKRTSSLSCPAENQKQQQDCLDESITATSLSSCLLLPDDSSDIDIFGERGMAPITSMTTSDSTKHGGKGSYQSFVSPAKIAKHSQKAIAQGKQSSPQSVLEGLAVPRGQSSSFPRHRETRKGRSMLRQHSSRENSATSSDDNEASKESHDGMGDSIVGVAGLQRVLFKFDPLVDKVHGFITGDMCSSTGVGNASKLISKIQSGESCEDGSNVARIWIEDTLQDSGCLYGNGDDYNDDYYEERDSDTLDGDGETTVGSGDDDDETSLESESQAIIFSMDASKHRVHRVKRSTTNTKMQEKKDQQQQLQKSRDMKKKIKKKEPAKQHSQKLSSRRHHCQNRGRSPTAKLGYNSDGESVRPSSHSRSRGGSNRSRRMSLSLSTHNGGSGSSSASLAAPSIVESVATVDRSVVESVLYQDEEVWMDMTHGPLKTEEECESDTVEDHFKKLLSVGIKLKLNVSPTTATRRIVNNKGHVKQSGRISFGLKRDSISTPEEPSLIWTNGRDMSYTIGLFEIQLIRQALPSELEGYPLAIPQHSFLLSTIGSGNANGVSLLFEAADESQMMTISASLRGIVSRLARKIVMGKNDWVVQMMLISESMATAGVQSQKDFTDDDDVSEGVVLRTMADVTDCLVEKTRQALDRPRASIRTRKTALRKPKTINMK